MRRTFLAASLLALAMPAASAAPLIAGSFYQETAGADCSFGEPTYCVASFSPAPANATLVVTSASCMVRMKNTNTLASLMMRGFTSSNAIVNRVTFLPPSFIVSNGFQRQYLMQAEIGHGFPAGQKPQIVAEAVGSSPLFTLTCTISGTLQK